VFKNVTVSAAKVLELALGEARKDDRQWIGPEHLLLGILQEGSGLAARILNQVNVDDKVVRRAQNQAEAQLPADGHEGNVRQNERPAIQGERRSADHGHVVTKEPSSSLGRSTTEYNESEVAFSIQHPGFQTNPRSIPLRKGRAPVQ
jgi:ATP-dependent Clp protease ATP-binding subunit ClpA